MEKEIIKETPKPEIKHDDGPFAIIFEYNLMRDKEIAFISCKSINNPETPKSGQYNKEHNCYYEWVDVINDFQEAMDKKNHYVDVYKPSNMIKKRPKNKTININKDTD